MSLSPKTWRQFLQGTTCTQSLPNQKMIQLGIANMTLVWFGADMYLLSKQRK